MESTLTLLSSAVAALGHLLFALAARRSGRPVPRAFSRVALALSGWSGALLLHEVRAPGGDAPLAWLVALALVPLGLELAVALHGERAPRLALAARAAWWAAAAVGVALAALRERAMPLATALLLPGLVVVLAAIARAARARGERIGPFVGAAAFALAAALVDSFGWFATIGPLPRLASLGSLAIVALLGSAVARHGLFELKPLLGRFATLALLALAAAVVVTLALAQVDSVATRLQPALARVVVTWLALIGLMLLRDKLTALLRSPAARLRERRRRELLARLDALDLVLAEATERPALAAALQRALVADGHGAALSEVVAIELLPRGSRPALPGDGLLLPLRVARQRLGWLLIRLRDPRLLEAPLLRRTLRRLAARVAVALRAIDAQEERQRSERLAQLGAMAAGIAHEIKNPLGAILGALDLVEGDPAIAASPSARWLKILRDEARRLDRVVTDALALGRTPRREVAPVEPRAIAESALLLAQERAAKAGVEVAFSAGAAGVVSSPRLLDADQLRHALLNLVLNAISVQPAGGRVGVAIEDDGRRLAFHVRDDGPGIPPEQRVRLFEPFFTTRPTGSGLGLAVAQRAALAHGGTLLLAEPDGGYRGAHFVLTVPATLPAAAG